MAAASAAPAPAPAAAAAPAAPAPAMMIMGGGGGGLPIAPTLGRPLLVGDVVFARVYTRLTWPGVIVDPDDHDRNRSKDVRALIGGRGSRRREPHRWVLVRFFATPHEEFGWVRRTSRTLVDFASPAARARFDPLVLSEKSPRASIAYRRALVAANEELQARIASGLQVPLVVQQVVAAQDEPN